jgi:hypothetical protein
MIIEITLAISVLINIMLSWYVYKLLRNMVDIADGFEGIRAKLIEFAVHLKGLNAIETYYGDPSITALVEHMKQLASDIEAYSKYFVIFEDDIEEESDAEENP